MECFQQEGVVGVVGVVAEGEDAVLFRSLPHLYQSKAKVNGISMWTLNKNEPNYALYSVSITLCNAVSPNN